MNSVLVGVAAGVVAALVLGVIGFWVGLAAAVMGEIDE